MSKRVAIALMVLSGGVAVALPVGNPTEASLFLNEAWDHEPCDPCLDWCNTCGFRFGFYGDYVFNRHLEVDLSDAPDTDQGPDVWGTQMFTNAAYLALNFWDRFDVFATLGATDIGITFDAKHLTGISDDIELAFESTFSWSIGARLTLWECECFGLGVEGQYFRTRPDLTFLHDGDTGEYYYAPDDTRVTYSEWQLGLGASYRIATNCPTVAMIPYVAAKWSGCRLQGLNGVTVDVFDLQDMNNDKSWGFATGLSLVLCDTIGVNVEGRFGDEKALAVEAQLRF